jgi:hypothetical protein
MKQLLIIPKIRAQQANSTVGEFLGRLINPINHIGLH